MWSGPSIRSSTASNILISVKTPIHPYIHPSIHACIQVHTYVHGRIYPAALTPPGRLISRGRGMDSVPRMDEGWQGETAFGRINDRTPCHLDSEYLHTQSQTGIGIEKSSLCKTRPRQPV